MSETEIKELKDNIKGVHIIDPVIASDGYIYEKEVLIRYINSTNTDTFISPHTMLPTKKLFTKYTEGGCMYFSYFHNYIEIQNKLIYLLKSEINEENINKFLNFIIEYKEISYEFDNYGGWFKALVNNEKGIEYYYKKYFTLKQTHEKNIQEKYSKQVGKLDNDYIFLYGYHDLLKHSTNYETIIKIYATGGNNNIYNLFYVACYLGKYDMCDYIYNCYPSAINIDYIHSIFNVASVPLENKNNIKMMEFIHSKNPKLYTLYTKNTQLTTFQQCIINNYLEVFKYMLTIDPSLRKTEEINKKSVLNYLCLNGRIDMLKHLYSIDNNIYKDEQDKIELMTELKSSEYCGIILPFILEIL